MRWYLFLVACLLLFPAAQAYAGYSDPHGFSVDKRSLLAPSGGQGTLALAVADDVIYRTGYYSLGGGAWQPFNFSGSHTNGWITAGAASRSFSFAAANFGLSSTKSFTTENYVIIYSCTKSGSSWDCHGGKWQIIQFNATLAATGAIITSVSAAGDDGHVPINTLDSDFSEESRWSYWSDSGWIQYGLSEAAAVSQVSLALYRGDTRTHTFSVLVSLDSASWQTVLDHKISNGHTSASSFETFSFSPVQARYVRIVGHGNSDTSLWNSYVEVRIQNFTVDPSLLGGLPGTPTCSDGIKNQGEEGIDCGGPCAACPDPGSDDLTAAELASTIWTNGPDVSDWSITSELTGVSFNGNTICTYHTKAGEWPAYRPYADFSQLAEANPWIFMEVGGTWHACPYEWYYSGVQCRGGMSVEELTASGRCDGVSSWNPSLGDKVCFMVTTVARNNVHTASADVDGKPYNHEDQRSNIKCVGWQEEQISECGNNEQETGEQCDGNDLNGYTCAHLGFLSGDLDCSAACTFDTSGCSGASSVWPAYPLSGGKAEFIIDLNDEYPASNGYESMRSGLGVADLDNDGLLDYIVMAKENPYGAGVASIGAYDHYGEELWYHHDIDYYNEGNAESHGLPGWGGSGFSKGDVDGDGQVEIVYLRNDKDTLVVLNGFTGQTEKTLDLDPNNDHPGFGQCQIVNLRGVGDRDVVCQGWKRPYTNLISAFRLDTGQQLWERDDFVSVMHGSFRAADLDNDGLDEVAGGRLIESDGSRMQQWSYPLPLETVDNYYPHFDSVFIYDVRPDEPGLEVVLLEEGSGQEDELDSVSVVTADDILWREDRWGDEPQNAAIGDFDTSLPGLEIWCRSRFDEDQRPWVFDAQGNIIAQWTMNNKKPSDWSVRGIETIYSIDWDGSSKNLIAAKERHTEGKVAVIDPLTGDFLEVWNNNAQLIYVVDVAGDYREEILVFNQLEGKVYVYWNPDPNTNTKPRYWTYNYYQRQKDNYNYYSP